MDWSPEWQRAFERNNALLEQFFGQLEDLEVSTRRTGRLDNDDVEQIFMVMVGDDIPTGLRIHRGFHPETQIELFTYPMGDRDFYSSSDLTEYRVG